MTPRQWISAIRTNCHNQQQTVVDIRLEVRIPEEGPLKGNHWLRITEGGVTGYESVQLTKKIVEELKGEGWSACAGTPGSYDTLFVDPFNMQKIFKSAWLIKPEDYDD